MNQPERGIGIGRRLVLPAAAAALLAPRALAGATIPPGNAATGIPEAIARLDGIAQQAMQRTGIPGMAIAVVLGDEVVYLKGFGVRRQGDPATVDAGTVFPLASLSKPVASTVLAALVGDGLVAWDDPLIRHYPGFRMHDDWVTAQVTLRDMFAHRSGLPDHAGDALEDVGYGRDAVLGRMRYLNPSSSFRSHYAYTNFGLTAAAVAAAMAAGKPWEEVAADRLYRPAGMHDTSSRFADYAAAPNRTHGHFKVDGGWVARYVRQPDAQSPAGGVSSSARDMATWLRLQLGRGSLGETRIVQQAALDETHCPQIIRTQPAKDPAIDHASFYGLGWNVEYDDQGRVRWGHSGAFNLGAATCVNILPGERLGIVVLTNAQPIGVPEAVCRSFLDVALAVPAGPDWLMLYGELFKTAMAPDYSLPPTHAVPSPPLPAASYVGRYASDLFGGVEVAASGAGLTLKHDAVGAEYPMHAFDRDVFSYQPTGENAYGPAAVTFTVGLESVASTMTVQNLDLNGQGTFVREKA